MKQTKQQFGGFKWQFGATDAKGAGGSDGAIGDTTAEVAVTEVTYSDEAIAELLYMIEEEKLAGDIYDAFYEMYGLKIFDNIATSEDRHFDALIDQAEALGLETEQFLFNEPGSFEDPELQAMYDELIATGAQSLTAALEVGAAIETKDITDIAAASASVEGTSLAAVYDNLLAGSENHLAAFEALLA